MSHAPKPSLTRVPSVPERVVKIIKEKDRIILLQAKRIEILENEIEKGRKERDALSTKVSLLSYKLQMTNQMKTPQPPKSEGRLVTSTAPPPGRGSVGLKTRVGSPDTACRSNHHTPNSASRQRSSSGGGRVQRQRSYKRADDDDKVKRSRGWANAYELSQDLHDKQVEMLERKYGGHLRSKRAARVIQQAYRQYCMSKNFEKMRIEAGEKRLSRRLCEFGRSNTIWTDMVMNVESSLGYHPRSYTTDNCRADREFRTYTTSQSKNINQGMSMHTKHSHSSVRTVRVLQKSRSLTVQSKDQQVTPRKPLQRGLGLDLSTINETRKGLIKPVPSPEETNNNRNSYPELNDSSASDSPQDTPVEPTVDLPSVNFENLLESKETDILNDSFNSDSSQEVHAAAATHGFSPFTVVSQVDDITPGEVTPKVPERTFARTCNLADSPANHWRAPPSNDIQIRVEKIDSRNGTSALGGEGDKTPTQDEHGMLTMIYANTEVKLRKRKPPGPLSLDNHESADTQPSPDSAGKTSPEASPIWKRKSAQLSNSSLADDAKRMSNISEVSEPDSLDGRESRDGLSSSQSSDTASMSSESAPTYLRAVPNRKTNSSKPPLIPPKASDRQRKRLYRLGLNLFNKKPEKGIRYLIERRFVDGRPGSVAKFLIARKGLSKQMIGEYLGNLQKPFNMEVLQCFSDDIDLSGVQVDVALRKFQSYFRMPGEAQKIERLMEAFASRYCVCNPDQIKKFQRSDTIFLLAFAIIMLNTDLHNRSIKHDRKMKMLDFVKNLRGIDEGEDLDHDLLGGIYERIKLNELKPGADHVSQVMKVEQMIVGKKPQLALPHRRLVCYCRLYEVHDPNKREKLGQHQREVFLFNDVLTITKIFSKKKNNVTYSFRESLPLCGMQVYLFETPHYQHGIRLTTNIDGKVLITFNARNDHDRAKFVEDLKEAVLEMNEMEGLRIEEELQKQKLAQSHVNFNRHSKDSGVVDIELLKPTDPGINRLSAPECGGLKKNTLSNSLIDLSEGGLRRGSGGSLDSGMASTGSGSTAGQEEVAVPKPNKSQSNSRFALFGRKKSKASTSGPTPDTSEV